jgi:hypothetical protein
MMQDRLRLGVVALLVGGALTGGLLFGSALVSAQTPGPDDTPAAEDTPADSTTPSLTPEAEQTPDDGTTPSDGEKSRDVACDKDSDGQPDAGSGSGTRLGGISPDGGAAF